MSGQRRLLTWTLNAGSQAYEEDLEKYGHKIYALGVHEFQVEYDGEIYVRRAIPSFYDGDNYGTYRWGADADGDGLPDHFIDNAKTRSWMSWSFWRSIERGMRRWSHIRHYISFILFGATRVTRMFDNPAYQDNFIENVKAVIDNVMNSYNYPGESNAPYIKGIEIDFEASFSDSQYDYRTGDNITYMNILKRIKNEVCIPRGLALQVNAYAMWGKNTPFYYRFHDYELFANTTDSQGNAVIDELQIMTYDFSWNGSSPGASTPLWWFKEVSDWAKQCFGAPGAKLTMDRVFFGAAGYGHRWGIYDYNRLYGSTITYRNFIDWQNGLYKHNHSTEQIGSDGNTIYEWHNQEFLCFAGIEDQESKNQILQQHVYDYFKARYGVVSEVNGSPTARLSTYNGQEYITTYSRIQRSEFTNIVAESFAPSSTDPAPSPSGQVRTYNGIINTPITIKENGVVSTRSGIIGYQTYGKKWIPKTEQGVGTYCDLVPSGKVTYTLNVPSAGSYRLIALVSFIWYNQAKLGCILNGSHSFTIQPFADYYPLMFKASHWYDCGVKQFQAGANTITIDGDLSDDGTVIYGFIVCEDFKNNFSGGEVTFKSTVKPFKKKDGTYASVPATLAITSKALRQDPIPLIMWEDRFAQYRRVVDEQGNVTYQDLPDLTTSSYYAKYEVRTAKGNGDTLSADKTYCYDPANPTYEIGYSWGVWAVKQDPYNGNPDDAYAYWGDLNSGGRLLVNYEFRSNLCVEIEFRVTQAGAVGIQFGGSSGTDGYVFVADYKARKLRLTLNDVVIQEQDLPASYGVGDRTKLKVILHNGKGYFYFGYSDVKAFGGQIFDLSRGSGGVTGIYANKVEARFYVLRISTTDKWDLMEKFTVETKIGGQTYRKTFGAISRSGYTIDPNFGYLNFSGIDETVTRDPLPDGKKPEISLDYEFFITEVPGFDGSADIKVIFDDPGIWYAYLYVCDKEGASVTWCGDSYSFLDTMNRAVNEYGAKGIGLWTMGQEDPRLFETIPDVVPYHEAPPGI